MTPIENKFEYSWKVSTMVEVGRNTSTTIEKDHIWYSKLDLTSKKLSLFSATPNPGAWPVAANCELELNHHEDVANECEDPEGHKRDDPRVVCLWVRLFHHWQGLRQVIEGEVEDHQSPWPLVSQELFRIFKQF